MYEYTYELGHYESPSGLHAGHELLPLELDKPETISFFEMKAKACSEVFLTEDVDDFLRLELYQNYLDFIEEAFYPGNSTIKEPAARLAKQQIAHEFADDYLEHVIAESSNEPAMTPPYISRMRSAYEEMERLNQDLIFADL